MNIDGSLERKLLDTSFTNLISNHDIIAMKETWTTANSNIDLPGYNHLASHRTKYGSKGRHSGGIVIYCKTEIASHVSVIKNDYEDILWLKVNKGMLTNANDVYIATIYFSPNNSSRQDHIDNDLFTTLENDIAFFMDSSPNVILLGDFNARTALRHDYIAFDNNNSDIPLPEDYQHDDISLLPQRCSMDRYQTNEYGNKLINLCKATGLKIVNGRLGNDKNIGNYTCHAPLGSSVVDHMLTPLTMFKDIHTFSVQPLFEQHSIHCPLTFSIEVNIVDKHKQANVGYCQSRPAVVEEVFKWDDDKCSAYICKLQSPVSHSQLLQVEKLLCGTNMDTGDSISQAVSLLVGTIKDAALPMKKLVKHKKNQSSRKSLLPPWNTHECDRTRKTFKQTRNSYVKSKSATDRNAMVKARAQYCKVAQLAKKDYMNSQSEKFNRSRNDTKKLWKLLRSSSHKQANCPISCDEFKIHFEKLANTNKNTSQVDNDHELPMTDVEELDAPILSKEVILAINKLKSGKASGPDGISTEFIIKAKDILLSPLTCLFNAIFKSGMFPKEWSKGTIIPIFKKGSNNDPNNYRGITLNNVLAKLFSSIINNRLNKWAEGHNVYTKGQFGFRQGHSTIDAIFVLNTLINKVIQQNKLFVAFVDFTKAFDLLERSILWQKLLNTGISSKMLYIIKSMYNCVKSNVRCQGESSEYFISNNGVKQGDNLSPFLFCMYINDLEQYMTSQIST
jgi:hypothetical protein